MNISNCLKLAFPTQTLTMNYENDYIAHFENLFSQVESEEDLEGIAEDETYFETDWPILDQNHRQLYLDAITNGETKFSTVDIDLEDIQEVYRTAMWFFQMEALCGHDNKWRKEGGYYVLNLQA